MMRHFPGAFFALFSLNPSRERFLSIILKRWLDWQGLCFKFFQKTILFDLNTVDQVKEEKAHAFAA